jgi:hypothetical protein
VLKIIDMKSFNIGMCEVMDMTARKIMNAT